MSKLEDKLSASIKARPVTRSTDKTAAKPSPRKRPAVTASPLPSEEAPESAPAAEEALRPLHPRRVWPD
jgi:hypothetical protein